MNVRILCLAVAVRLATFLSLASAAAAEPTIFLNGQELVVQIPRLDRLRLAHPKLNAVVRLAGEKGVKSLPVDLSDRLTPDALVIDMTGFGPCAGVAFDVQDGAGRTVYSQRAVPPPTVSTFAGPPLQAGVFAAIEAGSKLAPAAAPRIGLPDPTRLRTRTLAAATRVVTADAITYPVVTDADLPGIGSNNYVVVSRQTLAPTDVGKCSLYFSYRKALFDVETTKLKEWRKMLIEVPLDKAWANGQGDASITLPLDRFVIHTTEEREVANKRWNAPDGYNILGGSSGGLYQGGQSAEVDDLGRIYISNLSDGAGLVRFNPHTGKFEQPPVSFLAETRKLLPTGGGRTWNWDLEGAHLVLARGRVYVAFDRNSRVNTSNGQFEICSGVVSVPQDHWGDAEAFGRDIRLHAASWPNAKFPLYDDEPTIGVVRKLGLPIATSEGIAFGGYRLDLDARGDTLRLARIKSLQDTVDVAGRSLPAARAETIRGLSRQRNFNIGSAGRQFVRQAYGECGISRAAFALTLPDAPPELLVGADGRSRSTFPGAPAGELTIRFDITAKIKSDLKAYGVLAAAMTGVSQGPNYAVIELPGEADQAIGVCEYNYFYSKLDFSRRAEQRKVFKTYLPLSSGGQKTSHPASVGLGPYSSTWVEHDDALWLYMTGYTGMARLKYAEAGRTLDAFSADVFHGRLSPQPIDGEARDGVKDFLHLLPAIDGRLIDIGRGRVGRGGGARSAGLELFDPRTLGKSQSAVEMNRCFGLSTPQSRLVFAATGGPPRQEIFCASGNIRPEYVADIDDPARRPANQDPKIFTYECSSAGGLRDLYGFALPVIAGGDSSSNIALSPCRQYLVVLQEGGTLLTYSVSGRRFVDGARLLAPDGQPIRPLAFAKPSASIWTSPDGRIFFHAALEGEASKSVHFYEVRVAHDGQFEIAPHLAVVGESSGMAQNFRRIVRCFLPDLRNRDGSYDLVLGGDSNNGGQPTVRVIDDFLEAAAPH